MQINPISFLGEHAIFSGVELPNSSVSYLDMAHELAYTDMASQFNIDVPKYFASLSYETQGEPARYPVVKITREHLQNVFKNLFIMDKNNFSHNDLDIAHIFYGSEGKVEFDCFRFADAFVKKSNKQYNLPDFMVPSNQINYECASLGAYIDTFSNETAKNNFLRSYLEESADYHKKKAEIAATPEMAEYETLQSEVLQDVDDRMIDLLNDRLNFLYQQRKAFTEWDEGHGACQHKFDRQRCINSIPEYLKAAQMAIDYMGKAMFLSSMEKGDKAKYYEYEAQTGEYFANKYLEWIEGMANYNFEPQKNKERNGCPLDDEQREYLAK
ncbi:hypothetical protein IJ531_01820, partial [bacterium]|nr:hypothetical protein [bacterium]